MNPIIHALVRPRFPSWVHVFVLAGILLLVFPWATEAQSPQFGAGWMAGATHVTELNSDATASNPLEPGTGFVLGMHVDRWYGTQRRIGLRYQGSYQQPRFDWTSGGRRIDAVSADLSLLVRLLVPEDGGPVFPYLAGGVGGIWYDLGTGPTTTFASADAFHDGSSRILPTGVLAAGADVPTGFRWGGYPVSIRAEVSNHTAFRSPLRSTADGSRHGAVHHLRFAIGMHSAFSP